MPSTHLSLHYHLVFSTKNRIPIIGKEWRANLHAYMGGIVRGIDGHPLAIGGVEDHAHLLIGLKATHRVGYVLRDVKADSSLRVLDPIAPHVGSDRFGVLRIRSFTKSSRKPQSHQPTSTPTIWEIPGRRVLSYLQSLNHLLKGEYKWTDRKVSFC